ncbi:MAG: hypothetical protein K6F91_00795 [Ruminococcus sp.]|nr:hypothetical protein [Ruminococcus sp.]
MKHTIKTIITITALTAVFSLCGCSDNADSGSSQNSDSSVSSSDSSSVSEKKTPAKERDMSPFANITKDNFKELCAFTANDQEFHSVGLINLTNGTEIIPCENGKSVGNTMLEYGLVVVTRNDTDSFVIADFNDNTIKEFSHDINFDSFYTDGRFFTVCKGTGMDMRYGVVDIEDNEIVPCSFKEQISYYDDKGRMIICPDRKSSRLCDTEGTPLIDKTYKSIKRKGSLFVCYNDDNTADVYDDDLKLIKTIDGELTDSYGNIALDNCYLYVQDKHYTALLDDKLSTIIDGKGEDIYYYSPELVVAGNKAYKSDGTELGSVMAADAREMLAGKYIAVTDGGNISFYTEKGEQVLSAAKDEIEDHLIQRGGLAVKKADGWHIYTDGTQESTKTPIDTTLTPYNIRFGAFTDENGRTLYYLSDGTFLENAFEQLPDNAFFLGYFNDDGLIVAKAGDNNYVFDKEGKNVCSGNSYDVRLENGFIVMLMHPDDAKDEQNHTELYNAKGEFLLSCCDVETYSDGTAKVYVTKDEDKQEYDKFYIDNTGEKIDISDKEFFPVSEFNEYDIAYAINEFQNGADIKYALVDREGNVLCRYTFIKTSIEQQYEDR